MAASPKYKVHNPQGEYIASCKHAEDAAAIVACNGPGSQIRIAGYGKKDALWTEGGEKQPAGESYDYVRERCEQVEAKLWGRS